MECVSQVQKVEKNLGIEFDPNENFTQPLQERMADALMSKVDQSIIKQGLEAGIITQAQLM